MGAGPASLRRTYFIPALYPYSPLYSGFVFHTAWVFLVWVAVPPILVHNQGTLAKLVMTLSALRHAYD